MKNYLKIILIMFFVMILAIPSFAAEDKLPVYVCTSRGTAFQLFGAVIADINGDKEKSEQLLNNVFNLKNSDACMQLKDGVKILIIPFSVKYKMGSINGQEFNLVQVLVSDGEISSVFYIIKEFYPELFSDVKDLNVNKEKEKKKI